MNAVVLDKTGTLTEGKPGSPTSSAPMARQPRMSCSRLVAAVERGSEHPLGEAMSGRRDERRLVLPEREDFEAVAGHGVAPGRRSRGRGRPGGLLDGRASVEPARRAAEAPRRRDGKTPVFVPSTDAQPASSRSPTR